MPILRARSAFTYARQALQPGQTFTASHADAKVLTALGRAEWPLAAPAPAPVAPAAAATPEPGTPNPEPDPERAVIADDEPPRRRAPIVRRRRGRYAKKDLRADE